MDDPLEQLALVDVPDPPAEFDRRLHERLNNWLTFQHAADLVLRAAPGAIVEFARAVLALVAFTLGGHYGERGPQR